MCCRLCQSKQDGRLWQSLLYLPVADLQVSWSGLQPAEHPGRHWQRRWGCYFGCRAWQGNRLGGTLHGSIRTVSH